MKHSSFTRFSLFIAFFIVYLNGNTQILLDPNTQQKFINPLPIPSVLMPVVPGGTYYEVTAKQFSQYLGIKDSNGDSLYTTVWGYNGTFPGPTFEVRKDSTITVKWINDLTNTGTPLPHLFPVDTSIHWAMPMNWPSCGVPLVTHLHGGHVAPESDGNPDAWFTPGFAQTGSLFSTDIYTYPNDQESATLWYHDHVIGMTRLNVYAGLAGYYIIRDDWEDALNLPSGNYEIPLVIQDRMFTENGDLFYPSEPEEIWQPDPSIIAEMFGDFILVNGKAWPVLNVEPRKYRFRFLNGSDSRFYNLFFNQPFPFVQIGADGGFLNAPVTLNNLLIGNGERKDIILDFSDPSLWGDTLILHNDANSPFPDGDPVDPATAGQIMAFVVNVPLNGTDTSVIPSVLRPAPISVLGTPDNTRHLILFEGTDEYDRLKPMLGTSAIGPMEYTDSITENPQLNTIEEWQIINTTMDAHPIHLHQVSFQLVSRQDFDVMQYTPGTPSSLVYTGAPEYPAPQEQGWEDTQIMYPGDVTTIRAYFDIPGLYVWHCHILSHEDHDMMRPLFVGNMNNVTTMINNSDLRISVKPNPFVNQTNITLEVNTAGKYKVQVYDILGAEIRTIADKYLTKGKHDLSWNGTTTEGQETLNGMYFIRFTGNGNEQNIKIIRNR